MSLKLHVVIHGASPAFMRLPGCPCPRCLEPTMPASPTSQDYADLLAWSRQAHTSASLVIEEDGVAIDHTLVDIGMGVLNNLSAIATPARGQPITRLLLTHGHLDHIGGLDGLLYTLELARLAGDFVPDEQPWPLPVYATRQTWQRCVAVNPEQPTQPGYFYQLQDKMTHIDITDAASELMALELHPALLVTPIPVEHHYDSVNYLFTFWPSGQQGDGDPIRIALCWDLLAYPDGRPSDVWQGVTLDPRREPLIDLMYGVDLLVIEMNSWRSAPIPHTSFVGGLVPVTSAPVGYGVRDLITTWQPRLTRIVHYSGWSDRHQADDTWLSGADAANNIDPARGPVLDRDLRVALQAGLGADVAVDVAYPGEVITSQEG
jgi:hypothetical protein